MDATLASGATGQFNREGAKTRRTGGLHFIAVTRFASSRLRGFILSQVTCPVFLVVLTILLIASRAGAQAGASLLVKPWEPDQTLEQDTSGYLLSGGHTSDGPRDRWHMSEIESSGRVRLFPGKEASPRFGYDLTFIGTHTNRPGFPSQLLDVSVAGGTFLSKNNGWITGLTLGVGYAGDQPFGNGRAWYGRADFVVAKQFSSTDALGIGVDYDGHRTYAPDIPLPGFGYSHQFDPTIAAVIGLPVTSITWKPIPHLRIFADYLLLRDADLDVGYEFIKHWTAFAAFQTRDDAFYISELPGHRRLLFSQRRVEAGIRWQPGPLLTATVAAGYAFNTTFRGGWDLRDYSRYLYGSDEPYLKAELRLQF